MTDRPDMIVPGSGVRRIYQRWLPGKRADATQNAWYSAWIDEGSLTCVVFVVQF
jgi:hypothetical protein